MDRDRIIARFGYDGDAEKIMSLAMEVRYDNASSMELLCAGMMLHRFALEVFTKTALENGNSMEQIRNTVDKIYKHITELADLKHDGELK